MGQAIQLISDFTLQNWGQISDPKTMWSTAESVSGGFRTSVHVQRKVWVFFKNVYCPN